MKKTLAIIAAMAMAFALCSCGNTADSEPAAAQTDSSVAASAALDDDSEASQADSSGSSDSSDSSSAAVTTTTPKADDPSEESTEKADGGKTTTAKNNSSNKTTTAKNSSGKTATAAKNNSSNKTTTAKNSGKTTTAKKATTPAAPSPAPETTTPAPATTTTTTTTTPAPTPAPPVVQKSYSEIADEMFNAINEERIKAGVAPLTLDPFMKECAMLRAEETVVYKCKVHCRPDGSSCFDVFNEVKTDGKNYFVYSSFECLGAGDPNDPHYFANLLLSSQEGHREAMLNPNYKIAAVGYYDNEMIGAPGTGGTAILLLATEYITY